MCVCALRRYKPILEIILSVICETLVISCSAGAFSTITVEPTMQRPHPTCDEKRRGGEMKMKKKTKVQKKVNCKEKEQIEQDEIVTTL